MTNKQINKTYYSKYDTNKNKWLTVYHHKVVHYSKLNQVLNKFNLIKIFDNLGVNFKKPVYIQPNIFWDDSDMLWFQYFGEGSVDASVFYNENNIIKLFIEKQRHNDFLAKDFGSNLIHSIDSGKEYFCLNLQIKEDLISKLK